MDEHVSTPHAAAPSREQSPGLTSGSRFGRYEILAPLGAGGMGEVYRARDTRLGRELAIKILSGKLSANPQNLQRFEREACSASALNHPNIVTIFEFGEVDSTHYIAMELVEGELLRGMLKNGAIPLQRAIPIAAQIADGLAKAHEAGIVHRDLKPDNVMISRDGFAKILDFGLAKLTITDSRGSLEGDTAAGTQTSAGMILGTIEYMSPEQASGLPVDFRSDHFSFGSILYEMVTGKRTFPRSSGAEALAAILRDDPQPVESLNSQAPAPLCWLIERCLSKNPKDRYESTRELARELATIREHLSDAPSRHPVPQSSSLPLQRTAFVGREREVAAVKELLLRDDVRLVTLTGPGGIGKTRLGLQAAGETASNFPGGVHFIPLAEVSDASLIPSIIAQALGVRDHARQVTIRGLKEYLHDLRSNLLVFFDNFEHMLAAAPAVADLISIAPKLKVLVTSRATLHIYGEHEFPVPSLALPDPQANASLADLAKNSAVALFVQRAAAIKPNFALREENAQTVANICIRLDGLPLAIELAAARIKLLSLSAMQTRLESSLQLLTGGAKDLPLRQQTLRGAIDWSFNLLNEAEQALFRRVSVFVGGCTLEGVEAVCNTKQDLEVDVLDGMESLVNKSLVQQIESPNGDSRFALLDTVREYGLERLAASGEEAATRRAHAAYFLVLAEESAQQVAQAAQTEWAAALELDHNNFRSALDWLTRSGNAEWGLRLGAALFQFWDMREHLVEARDRLGKLLQLPNAARNSTRVRALFAAGVLAGQQGDAASAAALIGESLAIARELDDKRSIGIALNALAVGARDLHQLDAARALFDESLAVWRELGDLTVVARSLSNLAIVVKQQGNFDFARSLYEESLGIFRQLGDTAGMAWSLNYQGDMAHELGDEKNARALYEQSLGIFHELGDKWGTAGCLVDLGNLARDRGNYQTALARYSESLKLFQELGQKRGVARLLDCLACSAAMQSKPQRALRLAGAAAAMRRVLSAPLSPAEQDRLEKTLELARQAVPPATAAAAWMEGWTKPPERAIQDAFAEA